MQPVSRQMPARILVSRNACHDGHSRGHIFHGGLAGATLIWFLTLLHTQADDTYKTLVQPILDSACVECHGAETQKGGLRLDSLEQLALGGSSGPVVLPGTQGQGTLLERLRHADPEERMPPAKKPPLAVDKIALIAEWVAQGAAELVRLKKVPFPQEAYAHWSLRPLSKPAVPRDSHDAAQAWIRNPVDSFIHAKLVEQKLSPSAEADRRTLIRRLYYDLTGLPPTPEAIEDFENSQREPSVFSLDGIEGKAAAEFGPESSEIRRKTVSLVNVLPTARGGSVMLNLAKYSIQTDSKTTNSEKT